MPGGWEGSDRRARLPEDWSVRRVRVLRRDGYRCQWRMSDGGICGERGSDVDHVQRGDDHRLENLQTLCRYHHARKSSAEGNAVNPAKFKPRRRAPEAHPGAL